MYKQKKPRAIKSKASREAGNENILVGRVHAIRHTIDRIISDMRALKTTDPTRDQILLRGSIACASLALDEVNEALTNLQLYAKEKAFQRKQARELKERQQDEATALALANMPKP